MSANKLVAVLYMLPMALLLVVCCYLSPVFALFCGLAVVLWSFVIGLCKWKGIA